MGTPAYMAPEQARGEVDGVDERADVFALGSILCEILTGQPAFTGRTSGEIQRKAAAGRPGRRPGPARRLRGRRRADRPGPGLPGRRARGPAARRRRVAGAVTAYLAGVQERLRDAELAAPPNARAEEAVRTAEAAGRAAEAAEAPARRAERRARRSRSAWRRRCWP